MLSILYLIGITGFTTPYFTFETFLVTLVLADLFAGASTVTTLPLWTICFLALAAPARLFCIVEVRLVL